MKKYVENKILLSILLVISLILGTAGQNNADDSAQNNSMPEVIYRTHVQNVGWQEWKENGEMSGTSGMSLRLEGIKINLMAASSNMKIKYQTHVQNVGWQEWKENGEFSGTEGKSLRLEAIRIKLETSEDYSVMYRTHVQNIGWQDWKYDGELSGTEGKSLRLEAIEIKIVPKKIKSKIEIETESNKIYGLRDNFIIIKGWKLANVSNTKIETYVNDIQIDSENITYLKREDILNKFIEYGSESQNENTGFNIKIDTNNLENGTYTAKINLLTEDLNIINTCEYNFIIDKSLHIEYSSHVQNIGWQEYVRDGETSGTSGKGLRLEGLIIKGINLPEGVLLKYKTHIQNIGWQDWKESGETSGTSGMSLRLEGIKIKLEGTNEYSVMYRTHVQNIGWQDWCYDGEISGTSGKSLRLEAIEIKIVPKISEKKIKIAIENLGNNIGNELKTINGYVLSNIKYTKLEFLIDNEKIKLDSLKRIEREDILQINKGYGDEELYNRTPGFEIQIDFSKYEIGEHKIKVHVLNEDNIIGEIEQKFSIHEKIEYSKGIYGKSGLKIAGAGGSDLEYYKFGSGPNVFFATFVIHGFEDLYARDGYELVEIANNFYKRLIDDYDVELSKKWTIYIFPCVNIDGLKNGTTNNGPGRTTLYSEAPDNKGIDLNRCWQIGDEYVKFTNDRNYNGTTGFQAYEAKYLRDFFIENKSKNGQTILVDLHGWTQQLIGDPEICGYYEKQFPENDKASVGRYGTQYMINWARVNLGSKGKAAKTALIELPNSDITGHESVINNNFSNRYIEATLSMLKSII